MDVREGTAALREALAAAQTRLENFPHAAADDAHELIQRAERAGATGCVALAAFLAADAMMRTNQIARAERCVAHALDVLAKSGTGPMGRLYQLHAILLLCADRIALAMAAARQALKCADLAPAERPYAYGTIAVCFIELYHLDLGHKVMTEHMLPAAAASGSVEALCACQGRLAGLLYIYACLAGGVAHRCTIGVTATPALETQRVYVQRAHAHLDACAQLVEQVPPFEQAWHFVTRALVTNLEHGFDAAAPWFERARAAGDGRSTRARMMVLANRGMALRIAGRHEQALENLREASDIADATDDDAERRLLAYEQALVYRALGRSGEAINAMELHMRLHAKRSLIATSWSHDDTTLRHYGREPELQAVRAALRRPLEPGSLRRADQFIERHLERRITVAEVARAAGVSTRKLQTLYKHYRNAAVSEVIREQKMEKARALLGGERLTVAQVADRLGYTSAANFSRDFRNRFGITPTAARADATRKLESFSDAD